MRKLRKHLVIFVVTGLLMVVLFGCSKKPDEATQKVIDDINALGEVSLDDESKVEKLTTVYSTLTDEQKNNVNNYAKLLDAQEKIEELKGEAAEAKAKEEEEFKNAEHTKLAIQLCKRIQDCLKNPSSFKIQSCSCHIDGEKYYYLVKFTSQNGFGNDISNAVCQYFKDSKELSNTLTINFETDGEMFASMNYSNCKDVWDILEKNDPDGRIDYDPDFILESID